MKNHRGWVKLTPPASLGNEPCIARVTIVNLNHIELKYYPFMISLDKCNRSCDAVDEFCTKICVPSKTKDVNVRDFNIITRINS